MECRLASAQSELRRLGPRGEAEGNESRAEPGGDVHRRRAVSIDAARVGRARMREQHLAPGVRQGDLTVVHVAGEDEVEAARFELVENAWVVAEEDREVRLVGQGVRVESGPAADDEPRIGACDPDLSA